jgi:hypothetical protein
MDELNDQFKKTAENFSLAPSPGTWMSVEADIRKRKRKKRLIIFFFLLAGMLIGVVFLRSNNSTTFLTRDSISTDKIQTQKNSLQLNEALPTSPLKQSSTTLVQQINPLRKIATGRKTFPQNKIHSIQEKTDFPKKYTSNQEPPLVIENEIKQLPPLLQEEDNLISGSSESSENCETVVYPTPLPESGSSVDSIAALVSGDSIALKSKVDSMDAEKNLAKKHSAQFKWNLTLYAGPATSYSEIMEDGDSRFISSYRDSSDKNLLTLNYHLTLTYNFFSGWGVYGGIGIVQYAQKILRRQVVYHYDTMNTAPFVTNPLPPVVTLEKSYFDIQGDSTGTVKNKFTYLEIPLGVSYEFLPGRKFNIVLLPEISFNKLIYSEGYLYDFKNFRYEEISDENLKPWLVSFGIGLSFQYNVLKNFSIGITPHYTNFEKSIYTSAYPISQRFQQTEFRFSLQYLLK